MTGVYVGSMTSDYEALTTREVNDQPHMAPAGTSEAMTANRVSWFYDLLGPSLTIDTACSSSLYALHLACQSLLLGETDMVSFGKGCDAFLLVRQAHQTCYRAWSLVSM